MEEDKWFQFCRVSLEWLYSKGGLDYEKWAVEIVNRAQELNMNTLAFDYYHGGRAVFNGSIAPKDGHIGDVDLLAILDRELHARGMRFILMNMGAQFSGYLSEEYSQWRIVDQDGKYVPCFPSYLICLNSPASNYVLQELTELLPRYHVDGFYIEGMFSAKGGKDCFCPHCETEFLKTYGYPIPRDPDIWMRNEDYKQFRANNMTNFVRRLSNVIRKTSPETVFMPCPSNFEDHFTDYAAWGKYADAITLERQWGYKRWMKNVYLYEIGMSLQIVKAESKLPVLGTCWISWGVDFDYAPSTPEQYKLNFAEVLLYGATPQLHVQTAFELDKSELHTVKEMFDFEEAVSPYLSDAQLVNFAALVVDWSEYRPTDNFSGFYKALVEKHIPFEVISKSDLTPEVLKKYKAVLLPNITRITQQQEQTLVEYNKNGGGIVSVYRTGFECENGTPKKGGLLAKTLGISDIHGIVTWENDTVASVPNSVLPQVFYKILEKHTIGQNAFERLQSFAGSYAEVETTTGKAIAQALDYDYSMMHRHHPLLGYYPGHTISPLIVVNEMPDCGRTVYFAGEFDKVSYVEGLPGTIDSLAEAALWAANAAPPVQIDVSPTVETATHFSQEKQAYTILFINCTSNQLSPQTIVRHVEAVYDIQIKLPKLASPVKNVTSVVGEKLTWEMKDKDCMINLSCLGCYEALIVELEP